MAKSELLNEQDHNKFIKSLRGSILKTEMENKKEEQMSKLTEDEKANLEDELFWCRENLKPIVREINHLKKEMNDLLLRHYEWKERFEAADRKYALGTKLTICGKGQMKKVGFIKALEKILEDKDKLKSFIKLLEDEGGGL